MSEKVLFLNVNGKNRPGYPHYTESQRDDRLAAFIEGQENKIDTAIIVGEYPLSNNRDFSNPETGENSKIAHQLHFARAYHTNVNDTEPGRGILGITIATNRAVVASKVPILGREPRPGEDEKLRNALVVRQKVSAKTIQIVGVYPPTTNVHDQFYQMHQLEDTYINPRLPAAPRTRTIIAGHIHSLPPDESEDTIKEKVVSGLTHAAAFYTIPFTGVKGRIGDYARSLDTANNRFLLPLVTEQLKYTKIETGGTYPNAVPLSDLDQVFARAGLLNFLRIKNIKTIPTPDTISDRRAIYFEYDVDKNSQ